MESHLSRLGGIVIILTAVVFLAGGAVVAFTPSGGLTDQTAGGLFYAGGVLSVLALPALYAAARGRAGWPGLVGFALAQVGIVMYATGMFLVLPLVADVVGAHDVFLFAAASVPVFPVGAVLFFVGSALLGFALAGSGAVPVWAARLYALGAMVWLVAFFAPVPLNVNLLFASNLVGGAGMAWMGGRIVLGARASATV